MKHGTLGICMLFSFSPAVVPLVRATDVDRTDDYDPVSNPGPHDTVYGDQLAKQAKKNEPIGYSRSNGTATYVLYDSHCVIDLFSVRV